MAGRTYFTRATFAFLKELKANNDREWFAENKHRYEEHVKDSALRLIEDFAPHLAKLSPHFMATPRSLFRIYRDTRFSKDKSPYKTWQGAEFPWSDSTGDDTRPRGAVGGYFHFSPGDVWIGGGMWRPERERLAAFRETLTRDPSAVFRAIEEEDSKF